MDVIILGPLSSASTWAFNVVRKILSTQTGKRIYSLFAQEGSTFLANVPRPYDDCVVKAHYLDAAFLALTDRPDCRVILTTRDPLAVVASAQARFGFEPQHILSSLSRTVASIRQLACPDRLLHLDYEQGATRRVGAVAQIARFLGVALDAGAAQAIFDALQVDNVKALLETRGRCAAHRFHPLPHHATQWHLGHVRKDGGAAEAADAWKACVADAVALLHWRPDFAAAATLRPQLFTFADHLPEEAGPLVYCDGEGRHVVYGPYLHLQPGVWEARLRLHGVDDSPPLRLSFDAYCGVRLASTTLVVAPERPQETAMTFDCFDHLTPMELRIETLGDRRVGKFRFLGVDLKRRGESQAQDYLRSVAQETPVPVSPLARLRRLG